MSIAAKLTELNNIKEDIKAALEYKGLTVTNQFDTYADQIRTLGSGGSSVDHFTTIGYNGEQMPWLNIQLANSQAVLDSWNVETTTLKGTNIMFYPVIDSRNITSASAAFSGMTNLVSVGKFNTGKVTTMKEMFKSCTKLITIPEFNVQNVTNMNSMFYGCTLLESIPALNVANVTDMGSMFYNCSALKEIPLFGSTGKVTTMSSMFYGCTSLTEAPIFNWNTSSVTTMSSMFNGCSKLKEISFIGCDLSKVTTWTSVTNNCNALEKVDFSNAKLGNGFRFSYFSIADSIIYDNIDTSAMTSTSYMFTNTKTTDASKINLANVTDMSYMFNNNTSSGLKVGTNSIVTNMSYMFNGCTGITEIDLTGINTSNVTTMQNMFYGCTKLVSIKGDLLGTGNKNGIFYNCIKLVDVGKVDLTGITSTTSYYLWYSGSNGMPTQLRKATFINIGDASTVYGLYFPYWGVEDAENYPTSAGARQSLIDSLITYSKTVTKTCTIYLSKNTLAVLTEDEINQINAKGYTLVQK